MWSGSNTIENNFVIMDTVPGFGTSLHIFSIRGDAAFGVLLTSAGFPSRATV